MHEMRPVIHRDELRYLEHRCAAAVADQIRHVVAHQRRIVFEAGFQKQRDCMLRELVERRAVAARPNAQDAVVGVERTLEPVALVVRRKLVRVFVQIAVMAELVAAGENRLGRRRIPFDTPARHEECLPEAEIAEQAADARRRNDRAVAQQRLGRDIVVGGIGLGDVQDAVGIEIEGHRSGAARAVRPGHRILDQHVSHSRVRNRVAGALACRVRTAILSRPISGEVRGSRTGRKGRS